MANTKIPSEQVEELLSKGKSHGGVLTYREIMDSMQTGAPTIWTACMN